MSRALAADSIDDIVESGVCVGCGICAAVAGPAKVRMVRTGEGRERPATVQPLGQVTMDAVNRCCPAVIASGLTQSEAGDGAQWDPVWGWLRTSTLAWAADPAVRFEGSTGGVLTALACHLLDSGEVAAIVHVGPDPQFPARSCWRISRTPDEVRGCGGSRYGPAAPLEGLEVALAAGQPFAFVGKPCDVSALRLRADDDPRLAELCRYRLAIVCGGVSEFAKTQELLDAWGVSESELSSFRYRGLGNPGATAAVTVDGRRFETSYQELWEDEGTWRLKHRCKICPDAIGMAADVIAADCWPGGSPTGEDEGFNAIASRTVAGEALIANAVTAGALQLGAVIGPRDWDEIQPHQVRKREAVWARALGQRTAGSLGPVPHDLGTAELARRRGISANIVEARGSATRAAKAREQTVRLDS